MKVYNKNNNNNNNNYDDDNVPQVDAHAVSV